ncbi:NAD(P)-dependent oxidoreductase [Candidatus Pacearchaeota archaeon]|nr:NAD(P)-dependent oxidoreductase [Candidatus Pacearchaeota archaeon]
MEKKKVLICGATGFIGRNIAERFSRLEEFEVYGTYYNKEPYENNNIKFIKADLKDPVTIDNITKGMDIVIQMAAISYGAKEVSKRPYLLVADNVIMNSLIYRSCFDNKVSHVFFPSCTIMYQSSETPLKETDLDLNQEMYKKYFGPAWTKVYEEKMCEFYSRLGDTKFTVFRHSNVYGPYDKYKSENSHVFAATITKVLEAQDNSNVQVWGTGVEERDLIHVDDIVDFIILAIKKQVKPYELVNVGLGKSISIINLVKEIIKQSEKNLEIELDPTKPSIKTTMCLDYSKAKEIYGWEPKISLEEGIKKTINWYRKNIK